ncbi:MAG: hypothetical protein AAFY56_20855 [Pseudomonadota bacterium]
MSPETRLNPVNEEDLEVGFRRLAAAYRASRHRYKVVAIVLIAAGVMIVFVGVISALPTFWLVVTGVMTIAVSIYAVDRSIEDRERLDRLQILREEWLILRRQMPADPTIDNRILGILNSTYRQKVSS